MRIDHAIWAHGVPAPIGPAGAVPSWLHRRPLVWRWLLIASDLPDMMRRHAPLVVRRSWFCTAGRLLCAQVPSPPCCLSLIGWWLSAPTSYFMVVTVSLPLVRGHAAWLPHRYGMDRGGHRLSDFVPNKRWLNSTLSRRQLPGQRLAHPRCGRSGTALGGGRVSIWDYVPPFFYGINLSFF
jgi:hypothetical protein